MRPERRESGLRDYTTILLRRKWWCVLCLLLVTVSAGLYTASQEPRYAAHTQVLIRVDFTPPEEVARSRVAPLLEAQNIETQVEILGSAWLMERARQRAERVARLAPVVDATVAQVRKTNIVSIGITSRSPQTASLLANALADAYVERSLELNRRAVEQALQYVAAQSRLAYRELCADETALRAFQERTGMMEAAATSGQQANEVVALKEQVRTLGADLRAAEAEAAQLTRLRRLTSPTIVSERRQAVNPAAQALSDQLLALELQRLKLQDEYTPDSRKIRQLDEQLEAVRDRLSREDRQVVTAEVYAANPLRQQLDERLMALESRRVSGRARQAALAAALPAENSRLATLPGQQVEFSRLTRRVKVSEASYVDLLARYKDLLITRGSRIADAAVISRATPPPEPVGPNLRQNLVIGVALGLLLGLALAFLVDAFDDSLKTPREAEVLLELPAIGLIGYSPDRGPLLAGAAAGGSPLAEAVRTLRSNLRFSAADRALSSLLVTSPGADDGKSTIAANLALAAAGAGQRVILVDADLRRPSLHRFFAVPNDTGLTSVLVGDASMEQALLELPADGLVLLTSGPLPPNPIELLEAEALGRLIARLQERADLVVFDSPPLLAVADGQILSSRLDGTLLVVAVGSTGRETARHATELLRRAGARVLGLVANKLRRLHGARYYYASYAAPQPARGNGRAAAAEAPEGGRDGASRRGGGQA